MRQTSFVLSFSLVFTGCAYTSRYAAPPDGVARLVLYAGVPTVLRNRVRYPVGPRLREAFSCDPDADREADIAQSHLSVGLTFSSIDRAMYLVGYGAGLGLIPTLISGYYRDSSRAHLIDAMHRYNDAVAAQASVCAVYRQSAVGEP